MSEWLTLIWRGIYNGSCVYLLQVVGVWPDPPLVRDHHVPVLLSERVNNREDHWDLTTQQVLPYIDGFAHVAKIAAAADVENNLVKVKTS